MTQTVGPSTRAYSSRMRGRVRLFVEADFVVGVFGAEQDRATPIEAHSVEMAEVRVPTGLLPPAVNHTWRVAGSTWTMSRTTHSPRVRGRTIRPVLASRSSSWAQPVRSENQITSSESPSTDTFGACAMSRFAST